MIAACRSVGSVSFSVIVLLFFCIDLHAPGCCCFCGFFVVVLGGVSPCFLPHARLLKLSPFPFSLMSNISAGGVCLCVCMHACVCVCVCVSQVFIYCEAYIVLSDL